MGSSDNTIFMFMYRKKHGMLSRLAGYSMKCERGSLCKRVSMKGGPSLGYLDVKVDEKWYHTLQVPRQDILPIFYP